MQITVSVPGKIHLSGEHSVVYGKPALLTAVSLRLYATIKTGDGLNNRKDDNLTAKILTLFQDKYRIKYPLDMEINVNSSIPLGSGMGSSAAYSSALIGALLRSYKKIWNPALINDLAFEAEKITHGNPSGADNSLVVFGGLVFFRKEFDFLKSIWSLPVSSYKLPKLTLINSGKPKESTKIMVEKVADFSRKHPVSFKQFLDTSEQLTKNMVLSLKKGDEKGIADIISQSNKNLKKIGVVSKDALEIISLLEKENIPSKICGAGGIAKGGGIILCFIPDKEKMKHFIKSHNFVCYTVATGEEGIRLENYKE